MKVIGKVLWWDRRDREGVIVDSKGREFYFNASTFPEFSKYRVLEGRFVQFSIASSVKHIKCAASVKLVPTTSLPKAKRSFESVNTKSADTAA